MVATSTGEAIAAALPFVLLIGFWIFLTRRAREASGAAGQDPVMEKLDEILEEIRRLRRAIEERPP